jgi:catalase
MAMSNPKGRVNYEPNSWDGDGAGPRESPQIGFSSFPAAEEGEKLRVRSETFADHFSQARQFYISQTEIEQNHIIDAFTFELSKVEKLAIRERMVAQLMNVDTGLAESIAKGLGLKKMPQPAQAAKPTRRDLKKSPALSIILNGPKRFQGRKLGVLVTDGVDSARLEALTSALQDQGAVIEIVAPKIGGVETSDGSWIDAGQKLDGGPSVLYDAVALLPSEKGAQMLLNVPAARDFVADAFAHRKFIAVVEAARPLLEKAGVISDDGVVMLKKTSDASKFIKACGELRFWPREAKLK